MNLSAWMQKHPEWQFIAVEDVIYVFNSNKELILMIPNWDWDHE